MIRLIGHLVAAIERHSSQKLSLHPNTIQIKRHGEIRQTCDILEDKAKHARSIYGSRRCTTLRDDKRHAGYSKRKSGRAEHSGQDLLELRHDIAQYRGAAHPLCFTDEVMEHQFPEGFNL